MINCDMKFGSNYDSAYKKIKFSEGNLLQVIAKSQFKHCLEWRPSCTRPYGVVLLPLYSQTVRCPAPAHELSN